MRRMRIDVLICLGLAYLLSMGTGKLAGLVASATYEGYVETRTVAAGEIGGPAGEDVFRAQSIDDLMSHETFTVLSPGIEYRNRGGGYYDGHYFELLTLPSGERVAARINGDSIQYEGEFYTSEKTLPVGRVVQEPLYQNKAFLEQIQSSFPLSRSDFYVDMAGAGGAVSLEDYTSLPESIAQVITVIAAFPLLHALGARLGVFPYFFVPKRLREQEDQ